MEDKPTRDKSHEDLDDQPTNETSKPQTTTDQPALSENELAEKYMGGSENDRG